MDFKSKTEFIKKSYNGSEIVSNWQKSAYESGIKALADELKIQFEEEIKTGIMSECTPGLYRAIGILQKCVE